MMIPLWMFIVSSVVFVAILTYQYIRQKQLEKDYYAVSFVLDFYIEEYGGLTVTQMNNTAHRKKEEDKEEDKEE